MAKLQRLETLHKWHNVQTRSKLFLIRDEIQASVKEEGLAGLSTKLIMLQKEQSLCTMQMKVLESLYFTEIRRRWRQIQNADKGSNEWIYDLTQTSFISWLEGRKEGDVFFYITGRVCL